MPDPRSVFKELAQLETLCAQFYGSSDPSARTDAEKALVLFSESTGSLTKCQFLLERAQVEVMPGAGRRCLIGCCL